MLACVIVISILAADDRYLFLCVSGFFDFPHDMRLRIDGDVLASASGRFTCYCEDYFESQDALSAYVEQYYASKTLCKKFSTQFHTTITTILSSLRCDRVFRVQHAKVSRQQ